MIRSALILLAIGAPFAPAWEVQQAEAQEADDSPLVGLETGQAVRIRVHGEGRVESRVLNVDRATAKLWLESRAAPFEATKIDSLWVGGRATGTGALIGGLAGGALSFGFGALLCSGVSEGGCTEWGTVAALSLAGAAGGALIGGAIGVGNRTWKLRYARGAGLELSLAIGWSGG